MKTSQNPFSWLVLSIAGFLALSPLHADEDAQTRIKFMAAKNYVEQFEAEVARAEGKPVGETHNKAEAMRRVAELMELFPEDERVLDFKARLRTAIMGGKGDTIEITQEMLAYLDDEKAALQIVSEASGDAWSELVKKEFFEAKKSRITFPSPDPGSSSLEDELGTRLVIPDFDYESGVYPFGGKQWVAIGSASEGYYYVDVSSRAFLECYKAAKRAKSQALGRLPEGTAREWSVLAEVTGATVMVPEAGDGSGLAFAGWIVEPLALWLPSILTASLDGNGKGIYAGEDKVLALKPAPAASPAIPADISPDDLLRLHLKAVKEKNWPLYLATVHDRMNSSPAGLASLEKSYSSTMRRLHSTFVHAEPFEVSPIRILEGENHSKTNLENLFLEEADIADNHARQGNQVEAVTVLTKLYDRQGRQVGSPHRTTLERSSALHENRWMIVAGDGF